MTRFTQLLKQYLLSLTQDHAYDSEGNSWCEEGKYQAQAVLLLLSLSI